MPSCAADGTATVAGASAKTVNTIGFVARASVGSGSLGSVAPAKDGGAFFKVGR